MEYLKRVGKILRESIWATPGTSFKLMIQILLLTAIVGGITYGLDSLIKLIIRQEGLRLYELKDAY